MFDRHALPPALFEFVVIADTHYMLDSVGKQVEFTSRRRQTARTEYALHQVAALTAHIAEPLIIHMGDIMQEFPEQPAFAQAREEALAQIARHNLQPRMVAGNHDVGDKPDPTMPASWVTPDFLADYHQKFDRSWYSWDQAGLHFVVLNSQIMNSQLPAADEQAAWLEADLAAHAGERIFLFLHLPPFLCAADEPDLGHYDNLGEPARGWLLDVVRRYRVEMLFAAHVHWAFYNHIRTTNHTTTYYTVPSVAFTRPGFSELFSSAPPAEQGRDDVEKLGFFLVRVHEEETRVHFIRTGGRTLPDAGNPAPPPFVTATSADCKTSLAIIARHPIAPTGQVPAAWPSTIRQPVRNDYGLLALSELGVSRLLVPAADLADRVQWERLSILKRRGTQLIGHWLYDPRVRLTDAIQPHREQLDGIMLSLLGTLWPDEAALAQLQRSQDAIPTTLSCVVPGNKVPGKQHGRSQIGYLAEQLPELDRRLTTAGARVDEVVVRCGGDVAEVNSTLQDVPSQAGYQAIRRISWLYTLPTSEREQLNSLAAALFGMLLHPESHLYLEPLVDLDRTMDAGNGLLDRAYNPRATFHLVRHFHTIVYDGTGPIIDIVQAEPLRLQTHEHYHHLHIHDQHWRLDLLLPTDDATEPFTLSEPVDILPATHRLGLVSGRYTADAAQAATPLTEPTLFYGRIE